MDATTSIRSLLVYSDEMNTRLLQAAMPMTDGQLDRPFEMGMGTLRKTLAHIYDGEYVWLERWKGRIETPWPAFDPMQTPAHIREQLEALRRDRDAFVACLTPTRLAARQAYRDSTGSKFEATLHDMLLHGIVHSIHHRAQAVNMIRHVGGQVLEVGLMAWRRQPVV
jgi:uncharacterized damage-inducible protein DinB